MSLAGDEVEATAEADTDFAAGPFQIFSEPDLLFRCSKSDHDNIGVRFIDRFNNLRRIFGRAGMHSSNTEVVDIGLKFQSGSLGDGRRAAK